MTRYPPILATLLDELRGTDELDDVEDRLRLALSKELARPQDIAIGDGCRIVHEFLAQPTQGPVPGAVTDHIEAHNPCLLRFHLPARSEDLLALDPGEPGHLLPGLADDLREQVEAFAARVEADLKRGRRGGRRPPGS